MSDHELPNELHVALRIEEYFNPGAEIINQDKKERENIALIKDLGMNLDKEQYYTVIYHSDGYIICLYNQKFDSLFGAMVVYKKLKQALNKGNLEEAWHYLTTKAKQNL